jgi:hypothetical protein
MDQTVIYPDVGAFNRAQSEMTARGFQLRSIAYDADHISVCWHSHEKYTLDEDGTLTDRWVRDTLLIRVYAGTEEFETRPALGFYVRDVHHAADGIYVLWCASLYPARCKEPDSASFGERWRRSRRARESPACPHKTEPTTRRRFYLGGEGIDCLCALCGGPLSSNEGLQ